MTLHIWTFYMFQIEKEVTDLMTKALKYCKVDGSAGRQYRAATIHHRLASLYHNSYRNQVSFCVLYCSAAWKIQHIMSCRVHSDCHSSVEDVYMPFHTHPQSNPTYPVEIQMAICSHRADCPTHFGLLSDVVKWHLIPGLYVTFSVMNAVIFFPVTTNC